MTDLTLAEQLRDDPSLAVEEASVAVVGASAASESMSTVEFHQEDGSVLVAASFQGSDVELHTFGEGENVVVQTPTFPDSQPQGIQEDGVNAYDETGPPYGLTDEETI